MDISRFSKKQLVQEINKLHFQVEELKTSEAKLEYAKKEIKQAKEYAEFLFKFTPSAVFTADTQRVITSWNRKAEEITGYSLQEAIGKSCNIFFDYPCKERCDVFCEKEEKPILNKECGLRRKDGKMIVVAKNADLLKDENDNVIGCIETFEDITVRKQAEHALQQSYKNLELQVNERTAELSKINEDLLVEIKLRKKIQKNFQESNEKLQRVLNETISALAYAVEKRDPYTAGHQQRVAELVAAIAKEMKLSSEQIIGVKTAATIHDIGKIYVPAEILSKPSRLTVYEFNIITTHAQVGYEILKDIEFPWPVSSMVLQHHERLDGSGYPNKIKGDEILLEAHILIVADVVEAMASHRPYRPALGIESALDEIMTKKGILYNPDVVDACINVFMRHGFKFQQSE